MLDGRRARAETMYGRDGCERLSRSQVGLFGAGVLGGLAGQQLALVGANLLVVDCDVVEPANLGNQAFAPSHVGRAKAVVRAEQYTALNPDCVVTPVCARIEDCGLGTFAGLDLILTGLDSRSARMAVCTIAWHLGIPWLDAGVEASGRRLGSVTFYDPRDEKCACYRCRYSPADVAQIAREGRGPGCPSWRASERPATPPSLASPAFAGIVSSYQAVAAVGFLLDGWDPLLGRQVVLCADGPLRVQTHDIRRSARCPMPHRPLGDLMHSASRTVGEFVAEARCRLGVEPDELLLNDRFLVPALVCTRPGCPRSGCGPHDQWRLREAFREVDLRCPACGQDRVPSELVDRIARPHFAELASRSWTDLGLPASDVVTARAGSVSAHFIVNDAAVPAGVTVSTRETGGGGT